jgi:hypothetical protein
VQENEIKAQQSAVNAGCAALSAAGVYGFCTPSRGTWKLVVITELPQMFARGDVRMRWQIANKVTELLREHKNRIAALMKQEAHSVS